MGKNYRELLLDPRWQKRRLKILERDDWVCQNCASGDETLHVHHIKYSGGMPWDAPDEDLITLCASCHQYEEELKNKDLYEYLNDAGVTRMMIKVLFEHIKWRMEFSEEQMPMLKFSRILDDLRRDDGNYVNYILSTLSPRNA